MLFSWVFFDTHLNGSMQLQKSKRKSIRKIYKRNLAEEKHVESCSIFSSWLEFGQLPIFSMAATSRLIRSWWVFSSWRNRSGFCPLSPSSVSLHLATRFHRWCLIFDQGSKAMIPSVNHFYVSEAIRWRSSFEWREDSLSSLKIPRWIYERRSSWEHWFHRCVYLHRWGSLMKFFFRTKWDRSGRCSLMICVLHYRQGSRRKNNCQFVITELERENDCCRWRVIGVCHGNVSHLPRSLSVTADRHVLTAKASNSCIDDE